MWIEISIPIVILLIILIRIKIRGFFWKAKNGEELNFKEFIGLWGKGIEGITPIQQTKTSLISMIPIIVGMVLGLVLTFLGKMYWITLVLYGSLPITFMQLTNLYQKYKKQKIIEDTMKQIEQNEIRGEHKETIVYDEAGTVEFQITSKEREGMSSTSISGNSILDKIKKGEFKR